MPESNIVIKGAREHNLREVDLSLPRCELICFTGVSGSGKSSLAFDTLFAEGQRRYVESLSSFARQFVGQMPKPDVDFIGGLSPSISISQKTAGQNPRSTVGTITEINDYLRVLYARCGVGSCPQCGREITSQTRDQILDQIIAQIPEGERFAVLAPLVRGQKGEFKDLFSDLVKQGFSRARVDGRYVTLQEELNLDRQMRHYVELVIDRLTASRSGRARLAEAIELGIKMGEGGILIDRELDAPSPDANDGPVSKTSAKDRDWQLSVHYACSHCGISFEPPSPQLFSFNSPQGMCQHCSGLGEAYGIDPDLVFRNHDLSIKDGVCEPLGKWKDLGRWKQHIYEGVAETMERKLELPQGTLLETPWNQLEKSHRDLWMFGTGKEHITFTWKSGGKTQKYGDVFAGLIPELNARYRNAQSKMMQRALEKYLRVAPCHSCRGARLNAQARGVRLTTSSPAFQGREALSLADVCELSISEATEFFRSLTMSHTSAMIAQEALKEIRGRLGFLINVGLEYLTLGRSAPTLSGGEAQRIRLAGQIGCGLVGVLYILDEPSIGLHARDNERLIDTLRQLRDLGNTVIVVEHDEDTMRAADRLVDFGPGPGVRGGMVVANGDVAALSKSKKSLTGKYLSGEARIETPPVRRTPKEKRLLVKGARHNNLKGVDVDIPLGLFVCVTGVSGSGKSSLVNDILVQVLHRDLNGGEGEPGLFDSIEGMEHLDKLIDIDQSPIGRTPRSNPATYIKLFDDIRKLYTQLPDAKTRGFQPGRFSFNVVGGRCEACEGNGSNRLEMDFLADVWVTCPVCEGKRFSRETLAIRYKGKSIADVLEMDVQEALAHFENMPAIRHKLQTLHDVGLDYIKLGQASPTLSGGEAQRIKLARELVKKSTGKTLYLLDEPTTGLHFADIHKLLEVLQGFVQAGNTVLVVEHNLDVIQSADWVIDLGPEGGAQGGQIIGVGSPEDICKNKSSQTGRTLSAYFAARNGQASAPSVKPNPHAGSQREIGNIKVRGARQHNLKGVDVELPRGQMTVFCGQSGSGKSSLAMDTIYAEGQRRYVESLSAYARQFVGQMQKPALDHIEGLSPAIAIEQKHLGHTPRSTVGTITEIHDYLRVLMSRLGTPYCPDCDAPIGSQTADQIVDKLLAKPEGTRFYLLAPLEEPTGKSGAALWEELTAAGYVRVRVDGKIYTLEKPPTLDRKRKVNIEVVVDRLQVRAEQRGRLADSVENALSLGKGNLLVVYPEDDAPEERWEVESHSQHYSCDRCGRSFEPLSPHNFSFNSALGWCPSCQGLGSQVGANPEALLRDAKLTLRQGALLLWPSTPDAIFSAMLEALKKHSGLPLDTPYQELSPKHRRFLLHGAGDAWMDVPKPGKAAGSASWFRFQFKGIYPALEEAARLSPSFRTRLESFVGEVECSVCCGDRLRDDAGAVRLRGMSIGDLGRLPLKKLSSVIEDWKLDARERKIAGDILREVKNRVSFLLDVGLEYLTLSRHAATLSGGEAQRIRLASQVGSGLCGVMYVLDEPTIGLHPRDNRRLLGALQKLRDLGNTLLIVEHDKEVVESADYLLDFGPRAGELGGEVVARGTPKQVAQSKNSVTGPYLSGKQSIPLPSNRRMAPLTKLGAKRLKSGLKASACPAAAASTHPPGGGWLEVVNARHNNLRGVNVRLPLGAFIAVTGVSGSGKSSLVEDVLYASLARSLHRAAIKPGAHDAIRGRDLINKVIRVDQQPLGSSPSSNPATYTGAFELIRQLFAQLPDAKVRGFSARRFSFNVPGGRCEACEGNGQKRIEMHFLPDVWVTCEACNGQRYDQETLAVKFHGQSISDVLNLSCGKALQLFENIPAVRRILQTLCDVGLDYVKLGQPAPTLSGGEAQRVKLAAELSRPDTGRTLYLLDEPTTGLHFEDIRKLLDVLNRLVDMGNTVAVIEHNLDVIKTADWIIEMGPEAGLEGGVLVMEGTPEDVAAYAMGVSKKGKDAGAMRSHTGEALDEALSQGRYEERSLYDPTALEDARPGDMDLDEVGKHVKMPWQLDGKRWHTQDRVSRSGDACMWDGRILSAVVERIEKAPGFSPTVWDNRSLVEICGEKKTEGWFFHALTNDPYLICMKFRIAKRTFNRKALEEGLSLKPLDEMVDLPVYGGESRVLVKTLQGPWQEVQIKAHSWEEIDKPAFWQFLDQAIQGFNNFVEKAKENPEDIAPWKVLGRKWHFSRKGFPPGKRPAWELEVLEELFEILAEVCPQGQFLWSNQQLVHLFEPTGVDVWATTVTKRLTHIELLLQGPKNGLAFGRAAEIGVEPELSPDRNGRDVFKFKFITAADLERGDLRSFLIEHLEIVKSHVSKKPEAARTR